MICSACVSEVPDEDVFCENCGARLGTAEPVSAGLAAAGCSCGAQDDEVDEDGFCLRCGKRVRRPASDHIEEAVSVDFAAVSDRGLRHDKNEDRFALAQGGDWRIAVVCDGVSTTNHAEVASGVVAEAVRAALLDAIESGADLEAGEVLVRAITRAGEKLKEQTGAHADDEQSASTTVVAALVRGEAITVAWAGDSRAYWVDECGALALTQDHSWLNRVLSTQEMSEAEARMSPQAHA
jgi:PPM family protein phosphatase